MTTLVTKHDHPLWNQWKYFHTGNRPFLVDCWVYTKCHLYRTNLAILIEKFVIQTTFNFKFLLWELITSIIIGNSSLWDHACLMAAWIMVTIK